MTHLNLFALGQPHLSATKPERDALATMLWPESDACEGRARLRRTLHRLHEAIGDDILDSSADSTRVYAHADLWLDSAAFRFAPVPGVCACARCRTKEQCRRTRPSRCMKACA